MTVGPKFRCNSKTFWIFVLKNFCATLTVLPVGDARGNVRGPPQQAEFMLQATWMLSQKWMAIHLIHLETWPFGPTVNADSPMELNDIFQQGIIICTINYFVKVCFIFPSQIPGRYRVLLNIRQRFSNCGPWVGFRGSPEKWGKYFNSLLSHWL